ncbi:MAG TPA: multicopper oxidase domain-containing protein [Euzebyales bacterium]|nr:multicopper oxidase domain-containing protein [Euzebyales bacterium]
MQERPGAGTSPSPDKPPKPPRDAWSRRLAIGLPFVVALLVLVVANQIGGVLIARDLRDNYAELVAEGREVLDQVDAHAPAAAAGAAPAEQPATPPEVRPEVTVAVSLTEFAIEPDVAEIPAWAVVTFAVTNDGETPHDLSIDGGDTTPMLTPGESAALTYEADGSGALRLICTVPGHDAAGMHLDLPIAADGAEAAAAAPAGAAAPAPTGATPENAAAYDGPKPPLELRDPTAPEPLRGTVHDVTWTVEEKVVQVAENVWQEMWTFDGLAPGPTLRIEVGDTVDLTLRIPEDANLGHSIDFHASQVAWNDEMRTINPGEELRYRFTATHAGIFMYHCGTAPALHHIGTGMYGAIIVEPEGGLPDVDREFVFVQGDCYLGPQGQPGDLTKMSAGAPSPDLVVWNGVANQYADHPIDVGVGERIRTWVLNAGPSIDSSYHVVGTIFDTVMKEGVELRRGNAGGWGGQALDLAPAQGGYAEFALAEDGMYPIVTHAFNQVGRGALGMFKAGDGGDMSAAGGH